MSRLTRDPELDQLVRSINERSAGAAAPGRPAGEAPAATHAWPPADLPSGNPMESLLLEMARRGASDLLIMAAAPPIFRVGGRLVQTDAAPFAGDELHNVFAALLTTRVRERMESDGAADFSLRLARPAGDEDRRAWRFRVNLHRQRGTLAASIRALPTAIPTLNDLHLPPSLAELVKPASGLVLVCGPTGAGKSTTLAALVGEINRTAKRHIITIEDPIEYEHRNGESVIEQVEVGRDAPSFAAALRAALRQDPDVILVGEMRDLDTVATALTAAETGHLILSTLHTGDAIQAIHRIIDVFPPSQQTQIKHQLAMSLSAIISQQLMIRADSPGRVVAVEVLLANLPVRNHIRYDKLQNLMTEITLGKRQGMIALEDSLARLVRQGMITIDDARVRSSRPDELESLLR
jgi:twitching motility protein PilT